MNAKPKRTENQMRDDERGRVRRGVRQPVRGGGGTPQARRMDVEQSRSVRRIENEAPPSEVSALTDRTVSRRADNAASGFLARRSAAGRSAAARTEVTGAEVTGSRTAGSRTAGSGAPRFGGRSAARPATTGRTGTGSAGVIDDDTVFATRGSAALAPAPAEPVGAGRGTQRGVPWLKVAPPMPVSVPRAPFVLLLLFVVVGGVLGILMINTKVNENAFKLRNLERQQTVLDREEQDLAKKIAEYESPNNLAAQARRLGLVPAGSPAFIRLPDGRIIGVPRPAGGEPSVASAGTGTRDSGEQRGTGR